MTSLSNMTSILEGCLPSLALLVMFASRDVLTCWQHSSTLIIAIIFITQIPHLLDKTLSAKRYAARCSHNSSQAPLTKNDIQPDITTLMLLQSHKKPPSIESGFAITRVMPRIALALGFRR